MDTDTANVMHANGTDHIKLHTSSGVLSQIKAMGDSDTGVTQTNKPDMSFPYGVLQFQITGVTTGGEVTVDVVFPSNVSTSSKYYKIDANGWHELAFGSNDGDNVITLTLKDGDATTDADGTANGVIVDPGALAVPATTATTSSEDDSGVCFIGIINR